MSVIGVIGGSGVYNVEGLRDREWVAAESSFGTPSSDILSGTLGGRKILFMPRHGKGHELPPSAINYRANIDALKRAGATAILSVSAVGSLKETLAPGCFVIVDQFIDLTKGRESSFFGPGMVAHVSFGQPVCRRMGDVLETEARALGIAVARGGTYVAMEGPQFSTLAESTLYRSWGADVIGMTNMPEAKLAREAELCYATVAMVTDYDCWHPDHGDVTIDDIIKMAGANAAKAGALIARAAPTLGAFEGDCPCGCSRALEGAIVTRKDCMDPAMKDRLSAVAGRALRGLS